MGHDRIRLHQCTSAVALLVGATMIGGCGPRKPVAPTPERPDVTPTVAPADEEALQLDASDVRPMFSELLAIDLPTVVEVAVADNLDIRAARQAAVASRGRFESAVGAAFPALVPTALFEHVDGTVRATEGDLKGVAFNTFQASVAIQWILNPGRIVHDIIAAKKRLLASKHQSRAVEMETLRSAVVRFYDLVLAQAHVSAAHQSEDEAQELLRITRLRIRTGTGVAADELRAEARLAERRQDMVSAVRAFYDASVALAVTLRLDATVTLAPKLTDLPPVHLVRDDIQIEELLGFALAFRPDLERVRVLVEAATEDRGAAWWGAYGPQFSLAYQYGGITGHASNFSSAQGIPNNLIVNPGSPTGSFSANPLANGFIREFVSRGSKRLDHRPDQTFGFSDQQRFNAGVAWRLSVSAFGTLKTAKAVEEQARIEAARQLDAVRAQVVSAAQASQANHKLIGLSQQQVAAAAEALRLTEANLRAGSMTTLDVLQAQDAATQARLRYAQSVVRYNQSQVDLLAAIGLIDDQAFIPAPDGALGDAGAESTDTE